MTTTVEKLTKRLGNFVAGNSGEEAVLEHQTYSGPRLVQPPRKRIKQVKGAAKLILLAETMQVNQRRPRTCPSFKVAVPFLVWKNNQISF